MVSRVPPGWLSEGSSLRVSSNKKCIFFIENEGLKGKFFFRKGDFFL